MTKPLTKAEKEQRKFDRAAKKAAASAERPAKKKAKESKPKAPKKAKAAKAPGLGHNSGAVNTALVALFDDYKKLDADAKAISKAKRDLKARAKEEHNVTAKNFDHEIRLQKLDTDQRIVFESNARDLKDMLGIQLSLSLGGEEDEGEDDAGDGNVPDPAEAARAAALH